MRNDFCCNWRPSSMNRCPPVSFCRAYMALHQFFLGERRVRYDEISASLTQLRRQGFLSGQNQCDPVLAELLVRQSIREKRFARLVAFVEQSAPMEQEGHQLRGASFL